MPFALASKHTNAASLDAAVAATLAALRGAAKPLWLAGPRLRARGRRGAFLAAAGARARAPRCFVFLLRAALFVGGVSLHGVAAAAFSRAHNTAPPNAPSVPTHNPLRTHKTTTSYHQRNHHNTQEASGWPVLTTPDGKGLFPEDHAQYIGERWSEEEEKRKW